MSMVGAVSQIVAQDDLKTGCQWHTTHRRPAPPSSESHNHSRSDVVQLASIYKATPGSVAVTSNGNKTLHSRAHFGSVSSNTSHSADPSSSISTTTPSSSTIPTIPTIPTTTPPPLLMAAKTRSTPYTRKASHARAGDETHVPRPRNAFIVFRSYYNQVNAARAPPPSDGSKTNQNDVSKQAGKAWKALSEEEQLPFKLQADKEKEEHNLMYPDYRYAPSGKSTTKKPAKRTRSSSSGASAAKTQIVGVARSRKSRIIAAEYTDSEDEEDDEYSVECRAPVVATARSLRPRSTAAARRYHVSSPRSDSPTPSATHSGSSPATSPSEAQTDSEDGYVSNDDIPPLLLSPTIRHESEYNGPVPELVPSTMNLDRRDIPVFMDNTEYVFGVKPYAASTVHEVFLYESALDNFVLDLPELSPSPEQLSPLGALVPLAQLERVDTPLFSSSTISDPWEKAEAEYGFRPDDFFDMDAACEPSTMMD
ncbi:hypothetical protein D9611_011986 [Ephemerocybe angulata]|uniref:HMG box domain-containing protein n=1 Tax=Ephemerocybe angulata TaxID=980116 RepID=A0A8H5FFB0_9AGAR|nr:hypothetical protein D9611_011986 [Tulosesus angulatus]